MKDRPQRLSFTAFARFLSLLGHPFLLIPLTVGAATRSWLWTAVVLASTSLPLTVITLRNVRRGTWSDADVSSQKQRPALYRAAIPVFLAVLALMWWLHASPRMLRSALATGVMLVAGILLNRWLKVSLHMMFAAYCAVVIIDSYPQSAIAVVIFVLAIGWSRWKLKRHTVAEIATGLLLGAISGWIAMH